MSPSAEKWIKKNVLDRVDARINKLEDKIVQTRERWPYELYGLKADDKITQYDDEIRDLKQWKNGKESTQYLREIIKAKEDEINRLKILALSAANTIAEYGEYGKAELIRRQVK